MFSHIVYGSGYVLMVVGTCFTVVSAVGVVQQRDVFKRQHAAAKPQLAGFLCFALGLACIIHSWLWTGVLVLAVLLQVLTAPVGAHMLAHATAKLDYPLEDVSPRGEDNHGDNAK